ncbi:MAG: T9SS type A sorting domain-containing protein, partial [candidate division Zixibacteria bacterium]|nr:T9SS type A sorting domain-containing protein [candidate division Zixibacteria bacterium]
ASPGDYDILAALWYDLDNNNQINSGDFRLDRQLFSEAFTVAPSLVERLNNHIPADYRLSQNYPNPFNPRTTIEFAIPHTAQVRLKIFNSLGEEAATLVDDLLSPGNYKAGWDAGDFASGIYFYRLSVTELTGQESRFINTKKLILSK